MADVTLGILAGGRAQRLGGVDKALEDFQGCTLLSRTLAAFARPGEPVLLSHPGSAALAHAYPQLRCVPDRRPGQPGPLAALEALAHAATTPWLLTAPVDLRDVPADLADRLRASGDRVVVDADGLQPLVALWSTGALREAVTAALDRGARSAREFVAAMRHGLLDIAPHRLGNLNTPEDFAA